MNFTGVTISGAYLSLLPTANPGSVEYLVVAGGGGGGVNSASGGGAGGLLTGSSNVSAGTTYAVTVGAQQYHQQVLVLELTVELEQIVQ